MPHTIPMKPFCATDKFHSYSVFSSCILNATRVDLRSMQMMFIGVGNEAITPQNYALVQFLSSKLQFLLFSTVPYLPASWLANY